MAPTLDPRRTPPEIDVPALSALLDGRNADIRALVRRNLVGVPAEMLRSPGLLG